jgi:ABC-type antimicrobial peptide transport system permease subunit
VRTLAQIADRSMARTSFALVLLAIAAVVALVLGAIGVYGVLSYVVSQRTREIGVRVALGARTADVRHLVLRQGLFITTLGLAFGLTAAIALTRLMTSMLFGVSPLDIPTFGLVAATIATIALAASAIPAWRAARLDPVDALRRD